MLRLLSRTELLRRNGRGSLLASSILGSPVEPVKPYVDELQPPPFALETVSAPERVAQT